MSLNFGQLIVSFCVVLFTMKTFFASFLASSVSSKTFLNQKTEFGVPSCDTLIRRGQMTPEGYPKTRGGVAMDWNCDEHRDMWYVCCFQCL